MGVGRSKAALDAMSAKHASSASKVIGPEREFDTPTIVFYQLGRKFVDNDDSIPQDSADVLYYTLSVGHHAGVMDCFDAKTYCSLDTYRKVASLFPEGSDVRYKLEGIMRSGEIQIDKTHVTMFEKPVDLAIRRGNARGHTFAEAVLWLERFRRSLDTVKRDGAVYLMGRLYSS